MGLALSVLIVPWRTLQAYRCIGLILTTFAIWPRESDIFEILVLPGLRYYRTVNITLHVLISTGFVALARIAALLRELLEMWKKAHLHILSSLDDVLSLCTA